MAKLQNDISNDFSDAVTKHQGNLGKLYRQDTLAKHRGMAQANQGLPHQFKWNLNHQNSQPRDNSLQHHSSTQITLQQQQLMLQQQELQRQQLALQKERELMEKQMFIEKQQRELEQQWLMLQQQQNQMNMTFDKKVTTKQLSEVKEQVEEEHPESSFRSEHLGDTEEQNQV